MIDSRVKKLAQIIVQYSTRVKPGDWVHIQGTVLSIPLVLEIEQAVLEAGGNITCDISTDALKRSLLENSTEKQLNWVSPLNLKMIREANVAVFIDAPENTHSNAGIPVEKLQKRTLALHEWHDTYMNRSAKGDLRWTMTVFPCEALAQEADMSLPEYEDFVYQATYADQEDPISCWQQVYDEQQKIVDWLAGKRKIKIQGRYANLELDITGRKFINSTATHNLPSGEIFTSPVETSANGWVEFTYPAIIQGLEIEGVRLEFKNGVVVRASAKKNEDFLLKMLDSDAGAHRLGELGIGTNYAIQKFTKSILFDEKIGGTFHLAVGSGFEEAGGSNKSSLHWDMICDARVESTMEADGIKFYQDGKFCI